MPIDRRFQWEDHKQKWEDAFGLLDDGEREKIFDCLLAMINTIKFWLDERHLGNLSGIEDVKFFYAMELTRKVGPEYLSGRMNLDQAKKLAASFLRRRQRTWRGDLWKQELAAQVKAEYVILCEDKEKKEILDIGRAAPPPNSYPMDLDPYCLDPETLAIRREERRLARQGVEEVRRSNRKRAPQYVLVLERLLDDQQVGGKDAPLLGVGTNEVRSIAFQARRLLAELVARQCEATAESQQVAKADHHRLTKPKKRTLEQLKETHWRKKEKLPEPRTIRVWSVYDGISPDDPAAAASPIPLDSDAA